MSIEVKVPALPESVADATVAKWYKKQGDTAEEGELLLDLETDKIMLEVPATQAGTVTAIAKEEGSVVTSGEVLGTFEPGVVEADASSEAVADEKTVTQPAQTAASASSAALSPAVRRVVDENNLDASQITGTGKGGRVTKTDVLAFMDAPTTSVASTMLPMPTGDRPEQREPMSRLRARIAERLLSVKNDTAMLTTFNEVNMAPVMALRTEYRDQFEKTHGVKLGFMSFFVKAAVAALKKFPKVNASIDGTDVVYHGYFDVGIAVSTPRGLVVPVIRNADQLSMAEIEASIKQYAEKARDGKLSIEEMTGGTFTITNGGVFGSMLSTPILNPPQSAILGMHTITKRAMVEDDQVVIRPMMYLALSYDHRIVDGSESVRFLVAIKEALEDPARLLLGV